MKRFVVMLALVTLAYPVHAQPSEDQKLAAFFDTWLERFLKEHPVSATGWGDHRYDDRMDDLSPAVRATRSKQMAEILEQLPNFEILRDWLAKATELPLREIVERAKNANRE